MTPLVWLAGMGAFLAALWCAGARLGLFGARSRSQLRARLRQAAGASPASVSIRRQPPLPQDAPITRLLVQTNWAGSIERLMAQAGLRMPLARFVLVSLCLAGLPLLFAWRARGKRLTRIEAALPDALELMARSLRAGHALPGALRIAAEEAAEPLAAQLRIVVDEVDFGAPLPDALRDLAARLPLTDIGCLVAALSVQRETGGNLPLLMASIADVVRERALLRDRIRVGTAEGRLSAWILGLLPLALGAAMHFLHPDFLRLLWDEPLGRRMLGAAALLMLVGVAWMRALVRIRL
ncbi:type II secretion system F family protein [Noviherbaspirillum pedocola]|uniref:Type II secretion system F family protein n=1 Tax=Noviherbaspirillum pedocola TaxID=2801341 RepID=A0A934SQI7_9BURK|nr:type II secretion system F family protein [Noviherbaspirillum pedocola]MBK4733657.1 type II secretion system F family protein [Noviherbaspirillum pedocola]